MQCHNRNHSMQLRLTSISVCSPRQGLHLQAMHGSEHTAIPTASEPLSKVRLMIKIVIAARRCGGLVQRVSSGRCCR